MARLENWAVLAPKVAYVAPELQKDHLFLTGNVYGHVAHKDGKQVVTSIVEKAKGCMVQTRNTIYELGKPSNHYVEWYETYQGKKFDMQDVFK